MEDLSNMAKESMNSEMLDRFQKRMTKKSESINFSGILIGEKKKSDLVKSVEIPQEIIDKIYERMTTAPDPARDRQIKKMAELGIVRSMKSLIKEPLKKGRLQNRYDQLQKLTDQELNRMDSEISKNITPSRFYLTYKHQIQRLLDDFGFATKWISGCNASTVVSFVVQFLEHSDTKYPKKLYAVLEDILDYYERGGHVTEKEFEEAISAFELWKDLPAYVPEFPEDDPETMRQKIMEKLKKQQLRRKDG
jgi:hypothetical protein